jgi:hypothetical protein
MATVWQGTGVPAAAVARRRGARDDHGNAREHRGRAKRVC